ncbi:hypothetical protein [Streptomyces millisiae]|uniref:DUF1963 domain-containing protein n=1 Tax=Streptomyces millisiae TaxID=3075542 RepID=A0ABU2LKV4_9ACTN|nr:hypothetical protein [Streptomyces sp. DSM 44918]MDT0318232.1 hypothetical protein [Streptomyces sp. DSM 44918]
MVVPRLAPLARTATRLHPRPGSPSPHDSSVGGPLLWPADEPWPHCDGPHEWDRVNRPLSPEDVRRQRTDQVAAAGRPWPDGPVPLLPVAQLYVRDVPLPRPPGQAEADLLQVLWCPFDHPAQPETALFWRSAAAVTEVLATPPEPPVVQFPGYLPEPCLLAPEQVTEYPDLLELGEELRRELADWKRWPAAGAPVDSGERHPLLEEWNRWRASGAAVDSSEVPYSKDFYTEFYRARLSLAPGWKVGGWTRWGLTDPVPRICRECGTEAVPLLTIASGEWDSGTHDWIPHEDRARTAPSTTDPQPWNPTMLDLAGGYDLQLYVCPTSPDHPHIELIQ